VRKLTRFGPPLVMLLASMSLVHYAVFWGGDWLFAPRLWWLTTLLGGAALFFPVAAWYYFGSSKAPILTLAWTIIAVNAGNIALARSIDLSKLSYSQGFNAEMAMLFLPPLAYFTAVWICRLTPKRKG
jgi:hypothetical protein